MNLLEKIDELQANSVTPEEFERTWGKSLEQYNNELADYVEQLYTERRAGADVGNHPVKERLQLSAAEVAEAAAATATAEREGVKKRGGQEREKERS